MKLSASAVVKLELEEGLREAVDRARAVTSHIARRRAERALAGDLRRFDLVEVDAKLAKLNETGASDVQRFHLAEQWRARLIEEGIAAAATFPGAADEELPRLVDAAQRERTTGRPPGAARALFRHIVEALKTQSVEVVADGEEPEQDDDAADDADDESP